MNCPHCPDTILTMSERQGIEIDYCPKCRGIWLDRGELDKLIEKARQEVMSDTVVNEIPRQKIHQTIYKEDVYKSDYKHKRKKSFLEELFD